jgi:hypothetical protein
MIAVSIVIWIIIFFTLCLHLALPSPFGRGYYRINNTAYYCVLRHGYYYRSNTVFNATMDVLLRKA